MTAHTIHKHKTRPKKRPNANKMRLIGDLVLLVAMLVAVAPFMTGVTLHELAGFIVLFPLLMHLVLDWKWIVSTSKRIFKSQPGEVRFNYWLNWAQFVTMVVVTVSGILISEAVLPMFGVHLTIDAYWVAMHEISAGVLVLLMGVHIAMHWRWLANSFRRHLTKPAMGAK